MKTFSIGIDVGGTNTDAVVIDEQKKIITACKTITTDPVDVGFKKVIEQVLSKASITAQQISGVFVGTTHATNALLQQKELFKVGVIRLTSASCKTIPSCYGWPQQIVDAAYTGTVSVDGGFECDGREIKTIHRQQIEQAVSMLLQNGMEGCAVVGVFSSLNSKQEKYVKKIVQNIAGKEFPISLSYVIGGTGFVERENATILNVALQKSMRVGFASFRQVLNALNITAQLYITQNNGTIISLEEALRFPILTISAGPTNSFVGATKLAGLQNAIVVDIGGTSTDVGIVINGFARRSVGVSKIAGIPLQFSMPDVISVALGGGSYITEQSNGSFSIGPKSCAKQLLQQAQAFGGLQLTLTDIALKKRTVSIVGADVQKINISNTNATEVLNQVTKKIAELVQIISGVHADFPVLITGGGSVLLSNNEYIVPEYAHVANAYGAALAEISGTVDTVVSLNNRDKILKELIIQAEQKAIAKGVKKDTLRVVEKEIIPYHYLPQSLGRVKITVAGVKV